MEEELKQILEDISTKLEELSKNNVDKDSEKVVIDFTSIKERFADLKQYLEGTRKEVVEKTKGVGSDLSESFEETRKKVVETKIDIENKIKENPLACLAATFFAGLIIGRITKKNKDW